MYIWLAGNTYYIVIDGWSGSEGNYQIEITPYDPLMGYTIYQDGFPVGSSGSNEWSTVLFTGLTTDLSYTVTANYQLLGIVDMVESAEAGPHVVTMQIDDAPVALKQRPTRIMLHYFGKSLFYLKTWNYLTMMEI